jgi:hypothetical protein
MAPSSTAATAREQLIFREYASKQRLSPMILLGIKNILQVVYFSSGSAIYDFNLANAAAIALPAGAARPCC